MSGAKKRTKTGAKAWGTVTAKAANMFFVQESNYAYCVYRGDKRQWQK